MDKVRQQQAYLHATNTLSNVNWGVIVHKSFCFHTKYVRYLRNFQRIILEKKKGTDKLQNIICTPAFGLRLP
jgi:hypothetical protein